MGGKSSGKNMSRNPLHVLIVFIGLILGTKKSKDRRTPTDLGNSYWASADSAFGTYQRVASRESLNFAHCCPSVRGGFEETRNERL